MGLQRQELDRLGSLMPVKGACAFPRVLWEQLNVDVFKHLLKIDFFSYYWRINLEGLMLDFTLYLLGKCAKVQEREK